jgi:hypothetical protein
METAVQRLSRSGEDAMNRHVKSNVADQNNGHAARRRLHSSGIDM